MGKRYSKWLGAYVYDMTEEQEKYLIDNGLEIQKHELIKYDDGIVRDIPHSIIKDNNKGANLCYDRKENKFYIQLNPKRINDAEELIKDLNKYNKMIKVLEVMGRK